MLDRIRNRLIDDWCRAWRFWSIRLVTIQTVFMASWTALPPDLRAQLPHLNMIAMGLALLTGLAVVTKQKGLHDD